MKRLGLVGKQLGYSFSPAYFEEKFLRLGLQNFSYELWEVSQLSNLRAQLTQIPGLLGFNVTLPYKQSIMPYLDALDATASAVGAVNTVVVQQQRWLGYNTDVVGFIGALQQLLQGQPCPPVLVVGAGGAAAAVVYALQQWAPQTPITVVSRKVGGLAQLSYQALQPAQAAACGLWVQCTPLGTWPAVQALPALPYGVLGPQHYLLDLVYNPAQTAFMHQGLLQGARVQGGLPMLHLQAEAAWQLWTESPATGNKP